MGSFGSVTRVALATCALSGVLTGCGEPLACSEVGAVEGVFVAIPKELFVRSGSVQIEVCDDEGCEATTEELGRHKTPVGRGADALWAELGRAFSPGSVEVTVGLRDEDDLLVASHHEEIELVRTWPNGKNCDGEGFVNGHLTLEGAEDL